MTGITKLLDDFAAEGQIVKASDLDDLCAQTNMDESVLFDTIATVAGRMKSKHDTLFPERPSTCTTRWDRARTTLCAPR